jgi:hypothetical protein
MMIESVKEGDAMEGLNPKQLIFVQEYLKDSNGKAAAIRAGYSEKTAESQASRMLRHAKVREYLNKKEEKLNRDLRELFVEEAKKAFEVMGQLMYNSKQDMVRYSAAKDILDRAGYKPVDRVSADVNHSYEEQLIELIHDE